jgi:hypothetical protein
VTLTDVADLDMAIVTSLANTTHSLSNGTNFISSTISGLKQDIKYSLALRVNGTLISDRHTLGKSIPEMVHIHVISLPLLQ